MNTRELYNLSYRIVRTVARYEGLLEMGLWVPDVNREVNNETYQKNCIARRILARIDQIHPTVASDATDHYMAYCQFLADAGIPHVISGNF